MTPPKRPSPDTKALAKELRAGHRAALARAITLIESRRGDHQASARALVQALLPETGKAIRQGRDGWRRDPARDRRVAGVSHRGQSPGQIAGLDRNLKAACGGARVQWTPHEQARRLKSYNLADYG